MSEAVHLFIVTDDAHKASYDVIGVHPLELPSFVRIVTKAEEISRLPMGVRCLGCWFSWGAREHDDAQLAWQERRDQGGLEGVTVVFLEKLDDWKAKRAAAEAKILAEALAERQDAPVMSFSEFANAQAAANVEPSSEVPVIPKKTRWS